jgi:hypothetical protein
LIKNNSPNYRKRLWQFYFSRVSMKSISLRIGKIQKCRESKVSIPAVTVPE